jgi:hypothetical protein
MSTPPNPEHITHLMSGVQAWASWRRQHPNEQPRLRGVNLKQKALAHIDLHGADLYTASFWRANLEEADLRDADLSSATLNGVSLKNADLRGANLRFARLVGADVSGAQFSGCHVYGCSIWNLHGQPAEQFDVVVTPRSEPMVTVDDLLIAQFVYLMISNNVIRNALQLMSSRAVLLLGRFTPERKVVLDAIRDELRARKYIPMMFDFEPLPTQTLIQTVSTLAHMARFIIADVTEARSVPHELGTVVPSLPMVPLQPILLASKRAWAMFPDLRMHSSVLDVFRYQDLPHLRASMDTHVIGPAEAKAQEQFDRWQRIRDEFA